MKKHLQICALQDNFQTREQVLAMPQKWHQFGFNCEQLLHTHADMYSANYDPVRHHELMAQYLANSRQQQMSVIVYMNCHILGPSLEAFKTQWGVRDGQGNLKLLYNTYASCCLNSPWREHFFQEIRDFAEFEVEGFFFDGPVYTPCFCPYCQEKFRAVYPGQELLTAPVELQKEFNKQAVLEFKQALHQVVKTTNPNWLMYFNEGLMSGRGGVEFTRQQLATDDLIGTEGGFFFFSNPKDHFYWLCAAATKLTQAVADGRPTVIFFAADHKPWGWTMHTPAESQLCYQAAISNGASVWYGLHCTPENLESQAAQVVKAMVQYDRKFSELYENSQSRAQLAVFYSFNTACYYRHSAADSDLYQVEKLENKAHNCSYSDSFQGANALLEHLSLAYDLVTELNIKDIFRYQVVLVPVLAMIDEETRQQLMQYVEQGGTLIMDGEAGCFDADGKNFNPARLQELLGAVISDPIENQNFNYFGFEPGYYTPDNAFNYLRSPAVSFKIEKLSPETEIIARSNEPMHGRYERHPGALINPVVVRHCVGKGQVYYFAQDFFGHYFRQTDTDYRKLLKNLLHTSSWQPQFELIGARPGLMFNVRQAQDGSVLVCLNNYISAARPIDEKVLIGDLKLRAPAEFATATELFSGQKLLCDAENLWTLPELDRVMTIHLQKN